jgi:hypothetical protein
MILSVKGTGFLKTQDVRGAFDYTNYPDTSPVIGTNSARLTLGQTTTPLAGNNELASRHQCFGKHSNPLWLHLDDM